MIPLYYKYTIGLLFPLLTFKMGFRYNLILLQSLFAACTRMSFNSHA